MQSAVHAQLLTRFMTRACQAPMSFFSVRQFQGHEQAQVITAAGLGVSHAVTRTHPREGGAGHE